MSGGLCIHDWLSALSEGMMSLDVRVLRFGA